MPFGAGYNGRLPMTRTRLVFTSDTHGLHEQLVVPDGDILIHAGDMSMSGALDDLRAFNAWLARLPHRHKIVIAGNHDFCFERQPAASAALLTAADYLMDSAVTVLGIRFYGSPWQPWFFDWAFNLPRGPALRAKWDLIPAETEVLITHGPPQGHGDLTTRGDRAGCDELLAAVRRLQPRLHVFGHIHEGAGQTREGQTLCLNVSACDANYVLAYPPIVLDWPL
jgi:predicted phosphohydrolase